MMKLKMMVVISILAIIVAFAANAWDKTPEQPKGFFEQVGETVDKKVNTVTTAAKRTTEAAGGKVNYVCTKSRQTVGKRIRTAGEKLYMFGQKLG
jgi:hypothetical protein